MFSTRSAWTLGLVCLLLPSCGGTRASSVPLGGSHEEEPRPLKASAASLQGEADAHEAPVTSAAQDGVAARDGGSRVPAAAAPEPSSDVAKSAPGLLQIKPYFVRQTWTRVYDLELDLKVGPGGSIDMKLVSHQEARFEVLGISAGKIDQLGIEYAVYTSKMTSMGATQDSPEELAGKRYVVTFARGQPEVREAGGGAPPKKQVDSVRDDAREPFEMEKALTELSQIAANGRGDFSLAGAVALAGGEDDDTKVPTARANLRLLSSNTHGEKSALVDLGYTLTNAVDDTTTVEVTVLGNLTVVDGPARYQTSTLQGPMQIRSSQAGAMQGRGSMKVTTSYNY